MTSSRGLRPFVLAGILVLTANWAAHPATFIVDRFDDDNGACDPGDCSIREALLAAEATPEADTIIVPSGHHTLSIPAGGDSDPTRGCLKVLLHRVTIVAPSGATIDAQGIDRVFRFLRSPGSRLVNLTLTGGDKTGGLGGGVYSEGSQVHLENVWITGNIADIGGGLSMELGTVTLDRVTISGNTAAFHGGGADVFGISQFNVGRLEVRNSTISGNGSRYAGGAVYIAAAGQLLLEYSTIADNTNRPGDETINSFHFRPVAEARYSVIEGTCLAGADTACIYLSNKSDVLNVPDLGLAPLALNGGFSPTHALLPNSPALDVVPLSADCPSEDQRGVARPQQGDGGGPAACDAGAYERVPAVTEIPTLGGLGVALFLMLVAGGGVVVLRR